MKDLHLAIYGSTAIPRAYCENCLTYAFIVSNVIQCCDSETMINVKRISKNKRMSLSTKRSNLPKKMKDNILSKQDWSCYYCGIYFDIVVIYKKRSIVIQPQFDHIIPFSFDGNDHRENLVATCQLCNQWKSNRIFSCLEEIQNYVKEKYRKEVQITDEIIVRIVQQRSTQPKIQSEIL